MFLSKKAAALLITKLGVNIKMRKRGEAAESKACARILPKQFPVQQQYLNKVQKNKCCDEQKKDKVRSVARTNGGVCAWKRGEGVGSGGASALRRQYVVTSLFLMWTRLLIKTQSLARPSYKDCGTEWDNALSSSFFNRASMLVQGYVQHKGRF